MSARRFIAAAIGLVLVAPLAAAQPTPVPPETHQAAKVTQPQAPPPPPSPKSPPQPSINVRVEVTLTDQLASAAPVVKTMALAVSAGGRASMRTGVQMPIPSTTYAPMAAGSGTAPMAPMASYNYRNMGLSLDVENVMVDEDGTIRLRMSVEYSPVDEKVSASDGRPPSFGTFQQTLAVVLQNGKPIIASQSSDPVPARDRRMTVEVKATILK